MTLSPDLLRLEVQVPAEGLANLVLNPDGELGAWGWSTPVANTTIEAPDYLSFHTDVSQAAYFATAMAPAIVGNWYAGRYRSLGLTPGHGVRTRIEFFDNVRNFIASGPQSAYQTAAIPSAVVFYVPAAQAPAGAAYARLRYDVYKGTGNPDAHAGIDLDNAMLTTDPTNIFSTVELNGTNLVPNPSFEGGSLAGWSSTEGTLQVNTSMARFGTYAARLSRSASVVNGTAVTPNTIPVTPGKSYWLTAYSRPDNGQAPCQVGLYVVVPGSGTVYGASSINAAGVWTRHQYKFTAPAGVTQVGLKVSVLNISGTLRWHYIDGVMLTEAINPAAPEDYFDGSTAPDPTNTYAWTGTANNSPSTRTTATPIPFDYADAEAWLDILGPTTSIEINRQELDLGTLAATVLDGDLDPSQSTILRAGVPIRVTTTKDGGARWTPVATDSVLKAEVSYDLLNPDRSKRARIALSAVDNLSKLANTAAPEVVATIDELAYVLEQVDAPWIVNTSSNQIATVTQVATIDSATVVDQVAITRDIESGYAWVNRSNVIHVHSPGMVPGDTLAPLTFTEADYTSLVAGYNTDDCINEVKVTWLQGVTGTEEVTYGPYRDSASIAEWDPHSATFKLAGATENATAIAAFAAAVLDANAVPQLHIREVTIPIREAADIPKALIDLCSKVRIVNTDNSLDQTLRVTSIKHNIAATTKGIKWTVTYTFRTATSVAFPQVTPAP